MTTMTISPGVEDKYGKLELQYSGDSTWVTVPALDHNLGAQKNSYSYQTLGSSGVRKVPTTSENTITGNMVLDDLVWNGNASATNTSLEYDGIFKASMDGELISFKYNQYSATGTGKKYSGTGYIVGLSSAESADAPVYQSPFTIEVDGAYTIGTLD